MPNLVYKVGNTINDKLYVGVTTTSLKNRWCQHRGEAIKKQDDRPLYQDMRKYGVDKFFIDLLEECPDAWTMRQKEIYWMRILSTIHPQGYNLQSPLTAAEVAVIKYNAWAWTLQQYAEFFGLHIETARQIRISSAWTPWSRITREHLPRKNT